MNLRRSILLPALVGLGMLASSAAALGPHEMVLLINASSPDSVAIGEAYARLRGVPASNVLRLDVPYAHDASRDTITVEAFTRQIWAPAHAMLQERRIEDHILAWVMSVDFPIRVRTEPVLSVQGLVFLRNRLPDPEAVKSGRVWSPLFAGPRHPDDLAGPSQSFGSARTALRAAMPLPCMMLGYMGPRGGSRASIMASLERAAASDATRPDGRVVLVPNKNVRSTCRDWQFAAAAKRLAKMGVRAVKTDAFPVREPRIIGLMTGAATVEPGTDNSFMPGSFAEHLTSFGAVFQNPAQSKLSVWLEAGTAFASGTVTEPYALWTKFPSASIFVHYAAGCTAIESFYQSVACPLQQLVVGDPLVAPWGSKATIESGLDPDLPWIGRVTVQPTVVAEKGRHFGRFMFLIDGQKVAFGTSLSVDSAAWSNGAHQFRVVAYRAGTVRSQAFVEHSILIQN